jgi:hypothetical protein
MKRIERLRGPSFAMVAWVMKAAKTLWLPMSLSGV